MAKTPNAQFVVPYRDPMTDSSGIVSQVWQYFFRGLFSAIDPLGVEKTFPLANNVTPTILNPALDIDGLSFNFKNVGMVIVDYVIQRVTTSTGAMEKIEGGSFILVYKPTSLTWVLSSGPSTAGITLSVTSAGQVQYISSNLTGTPSISKITWRARTLASKNALYSTPGGLS